MFNLKEMKLTFSAEENYVPPKYNCEKCGDTGIVIGRDGVGYLCACQAEKRSQSRRKNAKLPLLLRDKTLQNFESRFYTKSRIDKDGKSYFEKANQALKCSYQFIRDIESGKLSKGLLFTGPVGCGKTHLVAAIANELLAKEHDVLFLVVPEFLDELRATFGDAGEFSESQLINRAQKVEVLILDDLGAHNFSDWTKNKIFNLINYRVNNGLPTLITTNYLPSTLSEVVGSRTVSRLLENCKVIGLNVDMDIRIIKSVENE